MTVTKIFVLLALVCYAFATEEKKATINYVTHITSTMQDSTFYGILCLENDGKPERTCKIIRKSLLDENERDVCDLKLKGDVPNKFYIQYLSAEKALVTWHNIDETGPEYFIKNTIVHFPDCATVDANVGLADRKDVTESLVKYYGVVFNDDETFDIFFENSKLCGDKACRQTFDARGNKIHGPVAFYKTASPLRSSVIIAPNSFDKTYVVTELMSNGSSKISLAKPDGQQVLSVEDIDSWAHHHVSTAYNTIRVCRVSEVKSKIDCETLDASGNSLSKTSVDLGREANSISMYNLPNGEFVLINHDNGNSYVTKVGADGKRIGALKLKNNPPECKWEKKNMQIFAFKMANNRYCQYVACYSTDTVTDPQFTKQCFVNEDLK